MGNNTTPFPRKKTSGQASVKRQRKIVGKITNIIGKVWLLDWDFYEGLARLPALVGTIVLSDSGFISEKGSVIEIRLNCGQVIASGPDSFMSFD